MGTAGVATGVRARIITTTTAAVVVVVVVSAAIPATAAMGTVH